MGDIQKTEQGIQRDNRIRLNQIRKNILDSGILEMYIQMGLTGREYFIDPETNECMMGQDDSAMISQAERLKIMTTLVNKVLPVLKDTEEEAEQKSLLADIAKKMNVRQ